MDNSRAKHFISHLGRYDYSRFVFALLSTAHKEHIYDYKGLEDHAFVRDLSEGHGNNKIYGRYQGVYIVQDIPFELFSQPEDLDFDSPYLQKIFKKIESDYADRLFFPGPQPFPDSVLQTVFFLNNLHGFSLEFHRDVLLPKYTSLIEKTHIPVSEVQGVQLGNPDTFIELMPEATIKTIESFIPNHISGLAFHLSGEQSCVKQLTHEKYITSGILQNSGTICNPVYTGTSTAKSDILSEFDDLLSRNPKESELERFISAHYKDIFGSRYDRIETQLWLRFPELDISEKRRRLDVFLRNSISGDWELFELKRIVNLTGTYRDCPVLSAEISHALQQLSNYEKILQNQSVKDKFAREGIEYFEPCLHLVAGRKPEIEHDQWRWLVNTNSSKAKILTYDDLLSEMKLRFKEREEYLRQLPSRIT